MTQETMVLGIETTCDETAAAVVRGDRRILSSVVRSQLDHALYGGVVPELAARAHVEVMDLVIQQALDEAGVDLHRLDAICSAAGPGLIGGVMVGLTAAKTLALALDKPFLAINHLEAHALTARLDAGIDFPYLLLLVSGGHTQILEVCGVGQYRLLGASLDDAVGEAFDKVAKLLGLGYPGGPEVERMAVDGNPQRFAFPRPMLGREKPDFSLSGLKTAVRQMAQSLVPLTDPVIRDICASFQAAICDVIVDRLRCALALAPCRVVVIAGGVAANQTIATRLRAFARDTGLMLCVPPQTLCTDNGAMIAWAGVERMRLGLSDPLDFAPRARWPLAEVSA